MRQVFSFVAIAVCVIGCGSSIQAADEEPAAAESPSEESEPTLIEFRGPNPRPGYPDVFKLGYLLFDNTVSPNKQYGVIYPKWWLDESPDFIVDAKNSRILASLETEEPYFEHKGHGGLSVNWSPDSSAVLIENAGKWFPHNLVLVELKNGKVLRQTQLLEQLEKMFQPAIAKHERPQARMVGGLGEFEFTDLEWKPGKSLQLEIKCEGQTNPKGFSEESSWSGELTAVWDVKQRKFIQHKIGHTSYQPAGEKEQ
jgi:hypothetical protein